MHFAEILRQISIAQTKKELAAKLQQYQFGICLNGHLLMSKDMGTLDGIVFIIPKSDFLELIKED